MFFILSKILAFLITPLIWIIMLMIWALTTRDEKRKRKMLGWALCLTLIFSNSFLFDEASRAWELPATKLSEVKHCEYGIVLGGMSSYDPTLERAQFFRGVDRLIQAVELYKRGVIKKIIFTGGSGSILHPDLKEGFYINRYLIYMGVPEKDFLIENQSQNTHENAVMTKQLMKDNNISGDVLLITSAFHMRRSLGCFRKSDIAVIPYCTDRFAGPRKFEFDHLLIPNLSAMNDWNNLIHEIMGYITYRLIGYA